MAQKTLPNWWQRENQRRMAVLLVLLTFVLVLIALYYFESASGRIGIVHGIDFDSANTIAFVRTDAIGNTRLYAVRADGTGLKPLTPESDKSDKRNPCWTADGRSVIYVSNLNDSRAHQLYILGNGEPVQLTYGTGNKDAPVVAPGGARVAFVTQGAIKTVNLNGTDVYQELPPPRGVTSNDSDAAQTGEADIQGPFLTARFNGDGKAIAGVQSVNADNPVQMAPGVDLLDQVARAVPPGGDRALLLDTGHEVSVDWDPAGPRLAVAFTELTTPDPTGKQVLVSGIEIWDFTNPASPSRKALMSCLGHSLEPRNIAWSPDGKRLAFEAWKVDAKGNKSDAGILVIDPSGPGARVTDKDVSQIRYLVPTDADGAPHDVRWSPDGSRLAYCKLRPKGGNDIWVINADGTSPINLTHGADDNSMAAWSPAKRG